MQPYAFRTLLWIILLTSFCFALSAQESAQSASIVVEVTDMFGAAVPHAQVQILPLPNRLEKNLTTDRDGKLSLDLPPGSYDLSVKCLGFIRATRHVEVRPGTSQTISIALQVGSHSGVMVTSSYVPPAREFAQTASIVLELTYQSGVVVPKANVLILPLSCTLEKGLTTGKDGKLSLNVPSGNYDLRVQVPGFPVVEKHIEAPPASHQEIAILMKLDNCTECLDVRTAIPVSFPEGPQAVSRDGRYVVVSTGRPSASRHTLLLEDRVLKTRRKLLNYGKRVVVSWDQYEDLVAVTENAGTENSRCTIFSVDQDVPPVEVLDLLRSELAESEQKCLDSMLRNQHLFVQGLGWDRGVFKVRVHESSATGERGFEWEYAVGPPPGKP